MNITDRFPWEDPNTYCARKVEEQRHKQNEMNVKNTCKTCRYWKRIIKHFVKYYVNKGNNKLECEIEEKNHPLSWRKVWKTEDLGIIEFKNGKCMCEKFIYNCLHYEYGQESENDALYYWDGEEYSAGFETGENFGCIHHELAERKES